jgi:hypothetical protein
MGYIEPLVKTQPVKYLQPLLQGQPHMDDFNSREAACLFNSEGIAAFSPRLRGTSYLGLSPQHSNRNAVAAHSFSLALLTWPQRRWRS